MENNQIQKTLEYSKFKGIKGNRELNEAHLAKLAVSIFTHNMLAYNPIIVNEKMEIVDGQHRFEIAKNNNLPIYYVVAPSASLEEVVLLNRSNKNWTLQNFINSFVLKGNEEYVWFSNFCRDNAIAPSVAANIIFKSENGNRINMIRSGKMKISRAERREAEKRVGALNEIMPFIKNKGQLARGFLSAFIQAYDEGIIDQIIAKFAKNGKSLTVFTMKTAAYDQLRSFAS